MRSVYAIISGFFLMITGFNYLPCEVCITASGGLIFALWSLEPKGKNDA